MIMNAELIGQERWKHRKKVIEIVVNLCYSVVSGEVK